MPKKSADFLVDKFSAENLRWEVKNNKPKKENLIQQ